MKNKKQIREILLLAAELGITVNVEEES